MSKYKQNESSLSDKADAAFEDVTTQVIKLAEQTGTPVVVWDNGHITEIPANEAERLSNRNKRLKKTEATD